MSLPISNQLIYVDSLYLNKTINHITSMENEQDEKNRQRTKQQIKFFSILLLIETFGLMSKITSVLNR